MNFTPLGVAGRVPALQSVSMNCDECKDLISVFMDNELDAIRGEAVRMHLAVCNECFRVCEDLASLVDVCSTESPSDLRPPNSKALWCRINNIIEHEVKTPPPPVEEPRRRLWRLSFMQAAAAVLFIAVLSSLLTAILVKNYMQPAEPDLVSGSMASQTTFEKLLSKIGLAETPQQARERNLKQRQAAIEYWNNRVQSRRVQWDDMTRLAFDRNLQVIDESVNDYTMILEQDPDDELSGEMLDSVLNDKMNLLRDFSDL